MDVPRLSTFEDTKKSFIQRCVSILHISNIRKNSCFFDEYIFSQEKKVELGSSSPWNSAKLPILCGFLGKILTSEARKKLFVRCAHTFRLCKTFY